MCYLPTPSLILLVLAAACISSTAAGSITAALVGSPPNPHVVGNREMGILHYSFPVVLLEDILVNGTSFKNSELRVYLRLYCSGPSSVSLKGFAGLFPNDPSLTSTAYFYKQPSALQSVLNLSLVSASAEDKSSWPLPWQDTYGQHAEMGLWPLDGPLSVNGNVSLQLSGSSLQHRLPLPVCTSSSRQLASQGERNISGLWNVVTTTSPNNIPPETMARLLLLHGQYHQRLGFAGTMLRCNQDEALLLASMTHIQAEIAAGRLIIWPWIWEQPGQQSSSSPAPVSQPYFWQVPRNQLSLLAGHGRKLMLAFFDLDEYLVLPNGGTVNINKCHGRPLFDDRIAGTRVMRYAALCPDCTSEELGCWDRANSLVDSSNSSSSGIRLRVTQCPCLMGKSILNPVKIVNTKVHKSTPVPGQKMVKLDATCGYLLHMQALISSKRPWDRPWDRLPHNETLVDGTWMAERGSGVLRTAAGAQQLMSARNCMLKGQELLRRCTQS